MTAPIEQIARDLAGKINSCHDENGMLHRTDVENLLSEALRQACGQQPAVADGAAQKIIDYMGEYLEGNPLLVQENAVRYALSKVFPAAHIPEGYKLVPIEPTQEMIEAGWINGVDEVDSEACYKCMLAAAPTHLQRGCGDRLLCRFKNQTA